MALLTLVSSFPTVLFTVLLAVTVLYWIFVLVGALDMDLLGGGDHAIEGVAKGALDGAADAALHGASDAALDGAADAALHGGLHGSDQALDGVAKGAADGAADAAADGAGESVFASFVAALKLRRAPITVVLTLFAAFGFLGSSLVSRSLSPTGSVGFVLGLPIFLGASVVSLLLTSVAIRPLAGVFEKKSASKHQDLIGKIVVVSTGSVTERFGQATFADGGAGLTLQVRAEASAGIKKGDHCVIVDYDPESEGFSVEPMPELPGSSRRPRIAVPLEGGSDEPDETGDGERRAKR
jgi:hypothetical protein